MKFILHLTIRSSFTIEQKKLTLFKFLGVKAHLFDRVFCALI
jgi:hypothetical protein